MILRLGVAALLLFVAGTTLADPETAYQGGKAISKTITSDNTKVDDRDLEARMRDKARELGASLNPASRSKDKSASEPTPAPSTKDKSESEPSTPSSSVDKSTSAPNTDIKKWS
jgi:ABC-type uncharacterized transport system involved in gliding motility auxiliary subunit